MKGKKFSIAEILLFEWYWNLIFSVISHLKNAIILQHAARNSKKSLPFPIILDSLFRVWLSRKLDRFNFKKWTHTRSTDDILIQLLLDDHDFRKRHSALDCIHHTFHQSANNKYKRIMSRSGIWVCLPPNPPQAKL